MVWCMQQIRNANSIFKKSYRYAIYIYIYPKDYNVPYIFVIILYDYNLILYWVQYKGFFSFTITIVMMYNVPVLCRTVW